MSKLYFKTGVMGSGKSTVLLTTSFEYRKNGARVILLKPSIDTREGDQIKSRVGLSETATLINEDSDLIKLCEDYDVVFVDESQFLSKKGVHQLALLAYKHKKVVMCYGLLISANGLLFNGAKYLIEAGAKMEEIKCASLEGRLTHHIVLNEVGERVSPNSEVQIGYNYKSVTWLEFVGDSNE